MLGLVEYVVHEDVPDRSGLCGRDDNWRQWNPHSRVHQCHRMERPRPISLDCLLETVLRSSTTCLTDQDYVGGMTTSANGTPTPECISAAEWKGQGQTPWTAFSKLCYVPQPP